MYFLGNLEPTNIELTFPKVMYNFKIKLENKPYYVRNSKGLTKLNLNINHSGDFFINHKPIQVNFSERKIYTHFVDLPNREKNINHKPIRLIFNEELLHSPARIDVKTGIIEYSSDFLKLPILWQDFIILHEIGHHYYKTEEYCDLYALKNYIDNYGNPSQAYYSLSKVFKRPEYQVNRLKNLHKNIIT